MKGLPLEGEDAVNMLVFESILKLIASQSLHLLRRSSDISGSLNDALSPVVVLV